MGLIMNKIGKGRKQCPKCETIVGARSLNCKNCNHEFIIKSKNGNTRKKRTRYEPVENWKDLKPGDIIKSLKKYGPYHPKPNGEIIRMGQYGKFKVGKIHEDGIEVTAMGGHAHSFIYMGEQKESKAGTILEPHKLQKFVGGERWDLW